MQRSANVMRQTSPANNAAPAHPQDAPAGVSNVGSRPYSEPGAIFPVLCTGPRGHSSLLPDCGQLTRPKWPTNSARYKSPGRTVAAWRRTQSRANHSPLPMRPIPCLSEKIQGIAQRFGRFSGWTERRNPRRRKNLRVMNLNEWRQNNREFLRRNRERKFPVPVGNRDLSHDSHNAQWVDATYVQIQDMQPALFAAGNLPHSAGTNVTNM